MAGTAHPSSSLKKLLTLSVRCCGMVSSPAIPLTFSSPGYKKQLRMRTAVKYLRSCRHRHYPPRTSNLQRAPPQYSLTSRQLTHQFTGNSTKTSQETATRPVRPPPSIKSQPQISTTTPSTPASSIAQPSRGTTGLSRRSSVAKMAKFFARIEGYWGIAAFLWKWPISSIFSLFALSSAFSYTAFSRNNYLFNEF